MFRHLILPAALIISLAGCASYPNLDRQRLESLPNHYVQFDAVLAWQISSAGGRILIDGEFQNVRYDYMEEVEIWVAALDPAGRTLARTADFPLGMPLKRDHILPFSVSLPSSAAQASKLRFTYKYRLRGGNDLAGAGNMPWRQSFEVPSGPPATLKLGP